MKVIGLIGGMSWQSSLEYYRIINETIRQKLGDLHSAKCLMYSVDFAEIEILQHQNRWNEATEFMIDAARRLEKGGADCVVICTNTMHKMAGEVEKSIRIPLLHIADATAVVINEKDIKRVGLLGTKFTMEQDFYKGRLSDKYNINVMVPDEKDRQATHDIIYDELCLGKIKESSRQKYIQIVNKLISDGAKGIILGCTEIPLLIKQKDCSVPVFDTTTIHARAAAYYAIE